MGWTVYNSDGKVLQSAELGDSSVTSAKIANGAIMAADINASAAIEFSQMENLTTARALVTDGNGDILVSGVTTTELELLDGLTSSTAELNFLAGVSGLAQSDFTKLAAVTVTAAEVNHLSNIASNVKVQIDAKAAVGSGTPSTQTLPDTAATGSSTEAARLDHVHTMPAGGSNSFTNDVTVTSGNLVMATAGKGIDFSAQADEATGETMTAELLDHYEEGTFTPSLTFDTPGDLNVVYSAQRGWYTRVGRHVTVQCVLITTTWTHSSASGFLKIAGLPFATIAAVEPIGVVMVQGVTGPSGRTQASVYMVSSTSYLKVYWSGSAANLSANYPGNSPSGTAQSYYVTISYIV